MATAGIRDTGGGIAFWAHIAGFVTGEHSPAVRRPTRQRVEWWDKQP
jgi:membrane associated rhomboid family serine protease